MNITSKLRCLIAVGASWLIAEAVQADPQTMPAPVAAPVTVMPVENGNACAGSCDTCCDWCPPYRYAWGNVEYLVWWMRGPSLPPLVTESPAGTDINQSGVLGTPGVAILFGDERVNQDARSGLRFSAGMWLNDCQSCGFDLEYFYLGDQSTDFQDGSDGSRQISRPFLNASTGAQDSELVSFPGVLAGTVAVTASTGGLESFASHFRHNCCCNCCSRLDLLVGYRYLRFADELGITEDLTALEGGTAPVGSHFLVIDRFNTENEFNGLDIGAAAEFRRRRLFLGVQGRLAVGVVSRTVEINGATTFTVPGLPSETQTGGLLAQTSNIGVYHSNDWSIVPELRLNLGYQIMPCVRAYVGYTILAMTEVAYAADQIDFAVNPNLLPVFQTPPVPPVRGDRPAFLGNQSTLWAHGMSFGMEVGF